MTKSKGINISTSKGKILYEGKKFTNKNGSFTIIEYINSKNVTIQFEDGSKRKTDMFKINNRNISNTKLYCNNGIFGNGKYTSADRAYNSWTGMIIACYSEELRLKTLSLIDCTIDKQWLNYQIFAEWYEQNHIENFVLDKDILIKGNKKFGPDTCCFVPLEINGLFNKRDSCRGKYPIGVVRSRKKFMAQISIYGKIRLGLFFTPEEAFQCYKKAKEQHIKNMADKWKNQLKLEVYQALYDYVVEITD